MIKAIRISLLLIPILVLTGCYGKAELDDLAYVIALGADTIEGEDTNEIQITYQVALPVKIAGENSETGKNTFTTYTTTAPSLGIANSKINTIASKNIDLSHTSLIVYSKELAEKGLEGHVNSLISNVSIRPKTMVSICEGTAKDFLEKVTPVLETSPARYFELLSSSFNYTSRSIKTEILDFYTASQSIYKTPIAVYSKLNDKSEAQFAGIAVFNGLKCVGIINDELILGHALLSNTLKNASINITDPEDDTKTVTLAIKQNKKSKIKVNITDGTPHANITLFVSAHLESSGGSTNFYNEKNSKQLNELIKQKIKNVTNAYLQETIKLKSDTIGFGRFAKINYLTWKEFEMEKWPEIYPKLEYEIAVESDLNISQIITHDLPISK